MAVLDCLEKMREWLEKEVCPTVELKLPSESKSDKNYPYQLVHPKAFLFEPPVKGGPSGMQSAPPPYVCVQLMEGSDQLSEERGHLSIRLDVAVWNSGLHKKDQFTPISGYSGKYEQGGEQTSDFLAGIDGWWDAWNFADKILRKIKGTECVGGMPLDREKGIQFGPYLENGALLPMYPYFHVWISFRVSCTVPCAHDYDKYL